MAAQHVTGLSAELPVETAAQLGLADRLATMRLRVESADGGPEAVHQLRVAARRAGAAITAFRICLKRNDAKRVKHLLRTLRRGAGPVRDWDILLGILRAPESPTCEFLLGYALGRREEAFARYVDGLAERREELLDACQRLATRVRRPAAASIRRFRHLAAPFRNELESFDRSLREPHRTAKEFHRLRIETKRLRYAMELFASCFDPALIEQVYPRLESLQDQLGAMQDDAMATERLDALHALMPDVWPRGQSVVDELTEQLRMRARTAETRFEEWRTEWRTSGSQLVRLLTRAGK